MISNESKNKEIRIICRIISKSYKIYNDTIKRLM